MPKKRRKESSKNKKEYDQDTMRKDQISIGRKVIIGLNHFFCLCTFKYLLQNAKYYCFLFLNWRFLLFFAIHIWLIGVAWHYSSCLGYISLIVSWKKTYGGQILYLSGKIAFIFKWFWCAGFPYHKQHWIIKYIFPMYTLQMLKNVSQVFNFSHSAVSHSFSSFPDYV